MNNSLEMALHLLDRAGSKVRRHTKELRTLLDTTQDPIILKLKGEDIAKRLHRGLRQQAFFGRDIRAGQLKELGFSLKNRELKYNPRKTLKEYYTKLKEE